MRRSAGELRQALDLELFRRQLTMPEKGLARIGGDRLHPLPLDVLLIAQIPHGRDEVSALPGLARFLANVAHTMPAAGQ